MKLTLLRGRVRYPSSNALSMSLPTVLIHSRWLRLVETTLRRVGLTDRAQVLRGGRALVYSAASRRNLGPAAARSSQLVETKSPPRHRAKRGAWSSRPCGRKAWLVIGEVATATERNGTCQPEPREWRRKRIKDGPKGAESRVASKAKDVLLG
jgi:hypothetical protein